jgi:hypothetical protein
MIEQRRQLARQLETSYLDQGINATVTTQGREAKTLHIEWILVSKVAAHQLSKNTELFAQLRNAGFARVELSDGYDDEWYWKLDE